MISKMKKNFILTTIVGSRLHGTATPESDEDIRGVFMVSPIEIISPFRTVKDSHWVEGENTDATAYELCKFLKMCAQGNPSSLEVLVGLPKTTTPLGEDLKKLLPKFLSKRCFHAFLGYSKNQEKKFRDHDGIRDNRKYKYACAHVRTLYQLLHLLKTGELIGQYSGGVLEELVQIKNGLKSDSDIFSRIFQLEEHCKEEFEKCSLPENADITEVEKFLAAAYGIG